MSLKRNLKIVRHVVVTDTMTTLDLRRVNHVTALVKKEMKHIIIYNTNIPLCGDINRTSRSKLYGDECGECYELARMFMRGKIKLADIKQKYEIL